MGFGAASFEILHFQRGVHAYIARRESSSRETTKIPRKAHAWRNRSIGLLHCYCHCVPLCGLVIAKDSYLLYSLLL